MAIQIIKRHEGCKSQIETIRRAINDAPQISYNSEGRIVIRIPDNEGGDVLIVLDRPLSKELIRFIKNGIKENSAHSAWCKQCTAQLSDELPF